ncbi:terminase small subunit [Candidatus Nomurabacteria bacterium]|nr:terminase small subunit [Candidatus Nomurabacteria bacterium]
MKKIPNLTKKQRGFVKDYVAENNGTKAVMKNYDTKNVVVAASIAAENLGKPYIVEAIEIKRKSLKQALIEVGVDEKKIAEKINVLLEATDESGKKDYTAIDKGLKHATAIYGVTSEPDSKQSNLTYNFIFSEEVQGRVKLINEEIKAKLLSARLT